MAEAFGGRYRANASHNAGILYHEYGHHIHRYTADFRGNAWRRPDRQDNRKTALDEGTCDYWAASLLGTPHIWAFHHRHDRHCIHPRSLVSTKTLADFDEGLGADPHGNGTIWGAALWDLRTRLAGKAPDGERRADLLVMQSLLVIGRLVDPTVEPSAKTVRRVRASFAIALAALLQAGEILHDGCYRETILDVFGTRGIQPAELPQSAWRAALDSRL